MENLIPRQLKVGDKIQCPITVGNIIIPDHTVEIAEIVTQEPWEWRNAYYIEFKDTKGNYHSWKQNQDGGKAILRKENDNV